MTETSTVPISRIRKRILDRASVTPRPRTKQLVPLAPPSAPELFPKSDRMKVLELRYGIRIEREIFKGSLNDLVRRFNYEADRSTLSRWRKYIRRYLFGGG